MNIGDVKTNREVEILFFSLQVGRSKKNIVLQHNGFTGVL